jgi:hypothetical protein
MNVNARSSFNVIFNMPIIENISWGNTKLSKAQIIDFGLKLD